MSSGLSHCSNHCLNPMCPICGSYGEDLSTHLSTSPPQEAADSNEGTHQSFFSKLDMLHVVCCSSQDMTSDEESSYWSLNKDAASTLCCYSWLVYFLSQYIIYNNLLTYNRAATGQSKLCLFCLKYFLYNIWSLLSKHCRAIQFRESLDSKKCIVFLIKYLSTSGTFSYRSPPWFLLFLCLLTPHRSSSFPSQSSWVTTTFSTISLRCFQRNSRAI